MNLNHRRMLFTACRLLVIALLCHSSVPVTASDREAAAQVRKGVKYHQDGDYEQAAEAFSKAADSLPANPRVAFNQGCVLAAQGNHEAAEERLREAALARDPELAADAHYNLGCLVAGQVKTLFGDQPDEAVGETRENGLQQVRAAVDHYRNALRASPEHAAAQRNLELLRIWSKHIQDRWSQRDRERRREQMNLLEFLAWLQDEQRSARGQAKALPKQLDTPTLRQTARKLAATQRELTLEIEPLKVKLDQALQPPSDASPASGQPASGQPSATPPLSPEMQQAKRALHGLADQAGQAMTRAAAAMANRQVAQAIDAQTEVLPPLNQLFEFVGPFEALLQAAIKTETALVETSTHAASGDEASAASDDIPADLEEAVEDQQFVTGWVRMLTRKAKQLLSATDGPAADAESPDSPTEIPLPSREADATPPTTRDASEEANAKEPGADERPDNEVDVAKTPAAAKPTEPKPTEPPPADGGPADSTPDADEPAPPPDPRPAYEKAVELGPRIVKLTSEAASDLQGQAWTAALPKQTEALQLLKEIAALLPPQESQDDDQQQQDQENQDEQKKQEQENEDQKKQDGQQDKPSDDEKKKEQDKDKSESKQNDDNDKKDADKKDAKKQNDPKQQQEKLSRQQAESLLRQVREREREHREFEKEIQRLLRSRIIVEKDW